VAVGVVVDPWRQAVMEVKKGGPKAAVRRQAWYE